MFRCVFQSVKVLHAFTFGDLLKTCQAFRAAHHSGRFCIVNEISQFTFCVGSIQGQIDKAGTQARQIKK